ncbi:hypothetical protein HYH03_007048 [Edaphochlamys debaryana]|uniref:Uncharacterized protein n=1 Tax=Edaphochlamys debaryana TaxID=47281 RepID=A0A835Y2L8_9CHLO|nr:hypothetical protein HYH03_007048 [Edaphochlamys debaryana]|eukprot:KAG2494805.1 hypothetical protein HYH03_007048 [Edaphochlamys debaryana]
MLGAYQVSRRRQLVVGELLEEAQRHRDERTRERQEQARKAKARGEKPPKDDDDTGEGGGVQATVALVAQRGSAACRLSRPQLQALAHLRRCAPTATALSARGRRSGVGFILAAASGAGGVGGGPAASAPGTSTPGGPSQPFTGRWRKRLPWPQLKLGAAGHSPSAVNPPSPQPTTSGRASAGSVWGPYVPLQDSAPPVLPRLATQLTLSRAPNMFEPHQLWHRLRDAITQSHDLLCGPIDVWQRRCDAFTSAAAKAQPLMRDALHEAEAALLDEEQDDFLGPAWEELEEAADADAVRYDKILTQMGLIEVDVPEQALYGYCSNLDGSQLLELAEVLRPGLLEASAAWAQLAQATEGLEACSGRLKGGPLQVLRAAVTGLLLLHGIPSAALEPWGGEGQGPEPLACAGVALIHIILQEEMDDEIVESEDDPLWTLSPPPGLLHYALCHGPIGVSNKAQPYPPTRYSADHLEWLTDQLMDRSLAYLKETELLRACMTPMGAVPSAVVLRRLSSQAFVLHASFEERCIALGQEGWQDGRLASPLLPDADLGRGLGLNPGLAPMRHGADGDGSEDWGGSYASVHSEAEEGSGGDEEQFHNCRSGTESGAEDLAGPGPRPAPASPAPHGPPPRCCLFDPLWWWAGRDGPGRSHGGGSSRSGGAGGSGGGRESPEPWEAELPWLAWMMRLGMLEQQEQGRAALTALLTETLTSVERQAHALLRQAQAQAQAQLGPGNPFAARSALTGTGAGGDLRHAPLLQETAAIAQEEARVVLEMRREDVIQSLESRPDVCPMISLLVLGLPLPKTAVETAEELRPGLLQAQPHTWGRLLQGRELEEGEPHAVQAARFVLLGLAAILHVDRDPRDLCLSHCVAAGWMADDVLAGYRDDMQPVLASWPNAAAMASSLHECIEFLQFLPYVRTAPGWTCAHDDDDGDHSRSRGRGRGRAGSSSGRQGLNGARHGAAIAHGMLTFHEAPGLHILLSDALHMPMLVKRVRDAGPEARKRAQVERERAEVVLAACALVTLEAGALDRLSSRALAEAGGPDLSPTGPASGPGPGPGLALAPALVGLLQAATHPAAAPFPETAAAVGADATPLPPLPPPCYGPGRDPAETRAALLRLAQCSPVESVACISAPHPPLQAQSLLLEGPEHATVVLAILQNLTHRKLDGVDLCHPLVFFPEVVHGGTGGGGAAAAGGGGGGAGGKQRAAGAWDPRAVRVLIHDLQVGCLPVQKGRHKDKYPWADMVMDVNVPTVTPTSALPKPRAAHLKEAKAALLDKGLGAIWVSGYGVVGALGALMLAAEVRREMQQLGRDCSVAVSQASCKQLDLEAQKQAEAEARRRSKAGPSPSNLAVPVEASGAKPWAGVSTLIRDLASSVCSVRDVEFLQMWNTFATGTRVPATAANVAASWEAELRSAEQKLLGLLSDGPGGCGPLREGVLVQLRIMECAPGRPGELVLPDMRRHTRAGAGGAPLQAAAKRPGAKR